MKTVSIENIHSKFWRRLFFMIHLKSLYYFIIDEMMSLVAVNSDVSDDDLLIVTTFFAGSSWKTVNYVNATSVMFRRNSVWRWRFFIEGGNRSEFIYHTNSLRQRCNGIAVFRCLRCWWGWWFYVPSNTSPLHSSSVVLRFMYFSARHYWRWGACICVAPALNWFVW